jgi:hypothetical protein
MLGMVSLDSWGKNYVVIKFDTCADLEVTGGICYLGTDNEFVVENNN